MNRRITKIIVALIVSVVAIGWHYAFNRWPSSLHGKTESRLEELMHTHSENMNAKLDILVDSLAATSSQEMLRVFNAICADDNYSYYLFKNKKLEAWHNALLPIQDIRPQMLNKRMLKADNGWYYVQQRKIGQHSLFALFRVRSKYTVSNDYLRSEYDNSLEVDTRSKIVIDTKADGVQVKDAEGNYLFTAVDTDSQQLTPIQTLIDSLLLIIWMIGMLTAICMTVAGFANRGYRNRSLVLLATLLTVLYFIALNISISKQMAKWFIFSPQVFAYDWWAPSLFCLLMFSGFGFIWCYFMYRQFDFRSIDRWNLMSKHTGTVYFFLLTLIYLVYLAINVAMNIMVYNSTDLAVFVGELDVSGTSMIKIVILTMLSLSFILVLERAYAEVTADLTKRKFAIVLAVFSVCIVIPSSLILIWFESAFFIGFVIINIIYFFVKRSFIANHRDKETTALGMQYSIFVWIMFIVVLFVMLRLTNLNKAKELQNRDVLSTNLSFSLVREDDPVAETLLSSIDQTISNDSIVQLFFNRKRTTNDEGELNLYGYLRERYFDGYFSRYNLQVVPCKGSNSFIQVSSSTEEYNCYDYFQNLINLYGVRITPKSNFYMLNDNDGYPSYFGQFRYYNKIRNNWDRLYIEINLKPQMIENGYPDLLTNSRDRIDSRQFKGYSYAKYFDGCLQTIRGEYSYPRFENWIGELETSERRMIETDNYSHLVYKATPNQVVVLSYPEMTISQFVADYSYLFLSMFIISMTMLFALGRKHGLLYYNMSIHERIQAFFIIFIIILLIVICILSAWESMRTYEKQSNQRMEQTLRTVKSSVIQEFDELESTDFTQITADNMMQRATRMLAADAHLYSPSGKLIGTSCRELFDNGIASPLINSTALLELKSGNDVFIQESIGKMEYYAVYSPLTDLNDKLVGYLEVPYFYDVSAMRTQLMSTLVPISNAYMIVMLLAVLFSYSLARGITKPLLAISQSIRHIELQKKNEKIQYHYNDEIGVLVNEYNRMTDELVRSAEQLATTEREMTWREMARQIAHEIKNPLTPMKLSVQYMLKAWEKAQENDEAMERFDGFVRKTANTLVEQIDQMAFIASEFSNVAKMQQGEVSRFDIVEKLEGTVYLFSKSEDATVTLTKEIEHAHIMANADQMTSVFNNLIKNALQSVPAGQHVDIRTSVETEGENVLIKVSDNGRGIAPEIREKIFKPNFTTKSTGMGLGLAIVKTIIVNAKGEIWFETEEGKGTTFFIRLPLAV